MDINSIKIKALNSGVLKCESVINELCSMRPDMHEIRKAKLLEVIEEIKKDLESESLLVFIGPFSSGKSTFINALLGCDILPTADKPCTAVVTELRIVANGQGNMGTVFKKDGSKEPGDYNKLIEIIDGPTGAIGKVAQIDHILLEYDVESNFGGMNSDYVAAYDISNPLRILSELGLKIVDCPGYGSPYYTNEEVLEKYISRASFTFWLSPADKLGGASAEARLAQIKKKTSTLIPVITMSDKVDERQKELVIDDFNEHLGYLFNHKEPRFISSYKFKKAVELRKEKIKKEKSGGLSKEEKQDYDLRIRRLEMESGMENLAGDLFNAGREKVVTDSKVKSALYSLTNTTDGLLTILKKRANEEMLYWKTNLTNAGWSETDAYKKLNKTKENIDAWIKSQSKVISNDLETALIAELSSYIMKAKKNVKTDNINRIVVDTQKRVFEEKAEALCNYIENSYKKAYQDLSIDNAEKIKTINITAPGGISITDNLKDTIFGVLDSLKYAGMTTVFTASLGACAVVGGSAVPIVGTVLFYAGFGLIAVAMAPLLPVINSAIKDQREETKRKAETELRNWLTKLNISPMIEQKLREENNKLYENIRNQLVVEQKDALNKYERSKKLIEEISETYESIKTQFEDVKQI